MLLLCAVGLPIIHPTWAMGDDDRKQDKLRTVFLELADEAWPAVERQARAEKATGKRFFYWDSYAVRALLVAHAMTGKKEYLEASQLWADRMLEYQAEMIPQGAYYMQYSRKPGQSTGEWYAADSSSIALGVLATAVHSQGMKRESYLESVQRFARLVSDNFVRPTGGVTDGHWSLSDQEWWCSTGIYGALAFHLYDVTGEDAYRQTGLKALDWLNHQDWKTMVQHFPPDGIRPTLLMYCLEGYSAGLGLVASGTDRHTATLKQLDLALREIAELQHNLPKDAYVTQWGCKAGGLPVHQRVLGRLHPSLARLVPADDRALDQVGTILASAPAIQNRDQLAIFVMLACAERLRPGSIYFDPRSKENSSHAEE